MKKILACALMLICLSLAAPAPAQDPTPPAAAESGQAADLAPPAAETPAAPAPADSPLAMSTGLPDYGLDMLWALGAFILVMVLLFVTLKLLGRVSRFRGGGRGRQSAFELRGIQPLDNRKYLAAVEIEGRLIVVGVTAERITPVAHWFIDDEDREGLDFESVSLEPETGLKVEPPEEDPGPLDISVADQARDK